MGVYETYADSENKWIGKIPEHWSIIPLKYLVSCNEKSLSENTSESARIKYIEIGDVSADKGITGFSLYEFGDAPSRARRIVKEEDVIISTVRTYLKAIAVIDDKYDNFVVSTGFAVLTPEKIDAAFLNSIVLHEGFIGEVISLSKGVSYPSITTSDLLKIKIPFPPLSEQKQIGSYLKQKSQSINRLIAKKERIVELLEEESTAIINQAVTKGLNMTIPMKYSGIEWLGEIPKHWKIRKLRYVGNCQNGISAGADFFGKGFPFVSYSDVFNNRVLPSTINGLAKSEEKHWKHYSVQVGDVFFTRTSETIEEIGFSSVCEEKIEKATFAGFLIRFRPHPSFLITGFSKYFFRCFIPRIFFVREMNLVTRASLSQELLKRLPILLPPLEEQSSIGDYLDEKVEKINQVIEKTSSEIEYLKEYKTTLISNAVIGKIDVREEILN